MRKWLNFFLLFVIVIIALFFRVYDINQNPPGFFVDEATNGNDAYSIFKTGEDSEGKKFPILFKASGEYRSPLWTYISSPIVGILGKTVLSVRLSSVIQGVITVILIYYLAKLIFKSRFAGVIASLLLAISPWHVFISRIGFEIVTYVMGLIMLTLILVLNEDNKKNKPSILLPLAIIFSFLTYTIGRLITPLVLLFFWISHPNYFLKSLKSKRLYFYGFFVTAVVLSIMLLYSEENAFFKRWEDVKPKSIFINQFILSYKNHFSNDYLFNTGDAGFTGNYIYRHSYFNIGQLHYFQLAVMIIGVIWMLSRKDLRKKAIFLLMLLVIFPLGSAIVESQPFATRSSLGILPTTIFSVAGIQFIYLGLKKDNLLKILYSFALILIAINIVFSVNRLFTSMKQYKLNYNAASYWGWQYGFPQIFSILHKYENNYEDLFISHRFSSNNFFYDFFDSKKICSKCLSLPNPITVDISRKQLFALREDDIRDVWINYPNLKINLREVVNTPGGDAILYVVDFY